MKTLTLVLLAVAGIYGQAGKAPQEHPKPVPVTLAISGMT